MTKESAKPAPTIPNIHFLSFSRRISVKHTRIKQQGVAGTGTTNVPWHLWQWLDSEGAGWVAVDSFAFAVVTLPSPLPL